MGPVQPKVSRSFLLADALSLSPRGPPVEAGGKGTRMPWDRAVGPCDTDVACPYWSAFQDTGRGWRGWREDLEGQWWIPPQATNSLGPELTHT